MVEEAVEYFPTGHETQEVEPGLDVNFPAGHEMQFAEDVMFTTELAFPAGQRAQMRPEEAYLPLAQAAVHDEAPLSEKVPLLQFVQAVEIVRDENFPLGQVVHTVDPTLAL